MSPEDAGAWSLLRRARANQLPRLLTRINRRTANAWERRHSKVTPATLPDSLHDAKITINELTRLRLPPGSNILLQTGEVRECDTLMAVFGEIAIPERAWDNIKRLEAPNSQVIFSIENKGAYVDFPAVDGATLLFLPGDNTASLEQVIFRMRLQPVPPFWRSRSRRN